MGNFTHKINLNCLLSPLLLSPVVSQFYESQVYDEYVIKGNAAVLKCNIPSFVSDHVEIIDWVDSNGEIYARENSSGKCQLHHQQTVLNKFPKAPYCAFSFLIHANPCLIKRLHCPLIVCMADVFNFLTYHTKNSNTNNK